MLALPLGRMVAIPVGAGASPAGAPGSGVVVVPVWPDAGADAISAAANTNPANPSLRRGLDERDSKRLLLRFHPSRRNLSPANDRSRGPSVCERALIKLDDRVQI